MNHSMISSAISMQGLQQKLDIIAHNMANLNTAGYKRKEAAFHDVLTNVMNQPAGQQLAGRQSPNGIVQSWGAKISQIQVDMAQGSLQLTHDPLDLAIEGDALFEIERETFDNEGNRIIQPAWTKQGSFAFSMQPGDDQFVYLSTKEGHFVRGVDDQPIRIPNNHRIHVDTEGNVTAYNEGAREAVPIAVGQLKLVHVIRPQLLNSVGDRLFVLQTGVDNADGAVLQPLAAMQGNRPDVAVHQGFIEQSNVQFISEMTELMLVQRAFQLNSRALVSADSMMNIANNIRGT